MKLLFPPLNVQHSLFYAIGYYAKNISCLHSTAVDTGYINDHNPDSVCVSVSEAEVYVLSKFVPTEMLIRQFRKIVAIISNKKRPWKLKFFFKQLRKAKFNVT